MSEHKFGWLRSPLDRRDFRYSAPLHIAQSLPPMADLRDCDSPIDDQGALGSCTSNAICALLEFDQRKCGAGDIEQLSRLQLYYDEREMEGTVMYDAGAYIRDGIKAAVKLGVAPENMWPYDIDRFNIKPTPDVYAAAEERQAIVYARVGQTLCQMQSVLAQGWPFTFGFVVYESFDSIAVADTGVVPWPGADEAQLGGHAVVAIGYNNGPDPWVPPLGGFRACPPRHFIVRNSWGPRWGDRGYCYMPYEYLIDSDLTDDLWVVQSVEVPGAVGGRYGLAKVVK